MQKILVLIPFLVLPMGVFAADNCGVIKKIETSPHSSPMVHFEDGKTVKIFDNWIQVSLATTAFATKARFCIDKAGTVSIEQ